MNEKSKREQRPAGFVSLVGAGPGDPELLTLKALKVIEAAEVVVLDRLVSTAVLDLVPMHAQRIDVGKRPGSHPVPQEAICELLIAHAKAGSRVVRLKGGDPFLFGRGGEEALALRAAGVAFEVIPGITAAQGSAARLGVPLTHRGLATGVRLVTGHARAGVPLDLDWPGLADPDTTLVVYMGLASIGEIACRLLEAGRSPATPVVAVSRATLPEEWVVRTSLSELGAAVVELASPTLFIIGEVASLAELLPDTEHGNVSRRHPLALVAAE